MTHPKEQIELFRKVIPDLNAIYHMQILLTVKGFDLGFFDVYEENVYGYVMETPIGINNL